MEDIAAQFLKAIAAVIRSKTSAADVEAAFELRPSNGASQSGASSWEVAQKTVSDNESTWSVQTKEPLSDWSVQGK